MVSLRRYVFAIAILALFTGLASAQITGSTGPNLVCTANVANPTYARVEGYTELLGDIVISCSGGNIGAAGTAVPTANITVSLNTLVTSRVFGTTTPGLSEALLLIDEPGSGVSGNGALLPQTFCGSVSGANPAVGAGPGGCSTTVGVVTPPGGSATIAPVASNGTVPNVFQGIVNGNQVTFNGVPMLAPATAGNSRVFRITNVRANAASVPTNAFFGTSPITAFVTVSSGALLQQSQLTAAYLYNGLNASATLTRSADNSSNGSISGLAQCKAITDLTAGSVLRFAEGFATAFKTRVQPTGAYTGAGTLGGNSVILAANALAQNIPGTFYNASESGFIFPIGSNTAGLADFGTRLKASFYNVPSGVTLYVSTTNINPNGTAGQALSNAPAVANTVPVNSNNLVAVLVSGETVGSALTSAGTSLPLVANTNSAGSILLAPVTIDPTTGNGTAVWEVISDNPSQIETAEFGVYYTYAGNPSATTTSPAGTIAMSFAPTFTSAVPSTGTNPIPRFVPPSTPTTFITTALCETDLLFPFVNSTPGFDTGLAIANTTADPFNSAQQNGACTLYFYGSGVGTTNTVPFPSDGSVIKAGTVNAEQVSNLKPGFMGYVIARCNFQLAHGYALFSDVGIRNWATGYIGLVIPTGTSKRPKGYTPGSGVPELLGQ